MQVGCTLTVVPSLGSGGTTAPELGVAGAVQQTNAAIAVALCREFDARVASGSEAAASGDGDESFSLTARAAAAERVEQLAAGVLPSTYLAGLRKCSFPGRAQCVSMPVAELPVAHEHGGRADSRAAAAPPVLFFLDGAHTPESMAACAQWFADASRAACAQAGVAASADVDRVLVFNCMTVREPSTLLPPLAKAACIEPVPRKDAAGSPLLHHALFAPGQSQYTSLEPRHGVAADLSWQHQAAAAWKCLRLDGAGQAGSHAHPSSAAPSIGARLGASSRHVTTVTNATYARAGWCTSCLLVSRSRVSSCIHSGRMRQCAGATAVACTASASVHASLQSALAALRQAACAAPSRRMHVLVTGSLHLVGDVLRALRRNPS
jgi:folylpolyglutamate synthase